MSFAILARKKVMPGFLPAQRRCEREMLLYGIVERCPSSATAITFLLEMAGSLRNLIRVFSDKLVILQLLLGFSVTKALITTVNVRVKPVEGKRFFFRLFDEAVLKMSFIYLLSYYFFNALNVKKICTSTL